ncbi:hypothetical protein A2673_03655 [Candidatus Kaiserbacteria bacterium RIFCSPHIGHO2_01_FULL_50_13]|uniref:O-antigen ligase-related domain-containing protein n=1 Tax=Candidatus Kaiserbacteria bacterium RIFCSPLOWO2_01_FULL_50_24 TaxID=1798507 RepID=A0A1F6EIW2_9BACT|nr:MAG: hypothetical protein A2673_03655 [Candidatus Kaiserbacteria bacterium RIFCSPHIGHO2_01_FULL_50_13]OGG73557.1 MAG: hypothetical protein A3A34_02675 [Candidatus Kaiserbacteria bacterium RIFCSPLOWO2_01_FULL_50_24]OGG82180.1 MAG: hypothetical protein A3H74_03295 [Candidatus Kaiserbacteria bacterium RIFCSPLOWO2_02_FULL_51_13]
MASVYSQSTMLEKTLRFIVVAGIFILPFIVLIVSTSLFFPYITGKNFTFRVVVEITVGAWIALACMNASYRPRVSALLAVFAAFVAAIALSDAFGVYPFKSFWSNFERMEGWVTLAHLFAYFTVVVSVMTPALWRRLFQMSLGVSAFVALYGLLQLFGYVALGWGGGGGLAARLDATLGNATYLAGYMLFHIFIAALLWGQSWMEVNKGRLALSLMYGSVIALDTFVLLFTGTRGAILGLVGGALLASVLLVLLARNSRNAWRAATGVVMAIVVLGGVFFLARDASWLRSIGFLDRLATISLEDSTTKARFMNWSMAWEGFKERPIFGWGQENYAAVFDKYYNPNMYAQEQWFDRVHNTIFDWLIVGGIVGLALYLALFVVALLSLWRARTESGGPVFPIIERSILTGLLAGYFFQNLFVFDNITSYILFVTVLAYIAHRSAGARPVRGGASRVSRMPLSAIIAVIAVLLVWAVAWGVNAKGLAQNRALLKAISQQENLDANLELLKQASDIGSFGTQEVREQFVQIASQIFGISQVPSDFKKQFIAEAVREMELQMEAMPFSARPAFFAGALLDSYGAHNEAKSYLERARSISPTKQTILLKLGINAFARGDVAEGLSLFKEAHELAPEFADARILYVASLIHAREDDLVEELLVPLIETGRAADPRIAAAYVERKRYDKIAALWEKVIAMRPESNVQVYFSLAAAQYASGNNTRAIEVLEEAKRAHPGSIEQIDVFIGQVRSGTARIE